jgi:hypothetical protein
MSSSRSSCPSLSESSGNASFSSWEMNSVTSTPPQSTRHGSSDTIKFEEQFRPDTPEGYVLLNNMHSFRPSALETISGFTEDNMLVPGQKTMLPYSMPGFNDLQNFGNEDFGLFQSHHGLPVHAPALEMDLSSPDSIDFVVPSQTTFNNTFDVQTPMRQIQFHSPISDYTPRHSLDHSPFDNMAFHLQYEDCKSATSLRSQYSPTTPQYSPTTPCRSSILRQPIFGPAKTSAALHRVQSDSQAQRYTRKRMKREQSSGVRLPPGSNCKLEPAGDKPCTWPGCPRKFKRAEHLKRHEKVHKPGAPEICPFCNHLFKGSRGDNLKTHVELHNKPDSKRTKFHAGAKAWLAQREQAKGKKKMKMEREESPSPVKPEPRSRGYVSEY